MPGRLVTLVGIGTLALASVGGCSDSAGGPPGSNGVPTASGASGGQTTGGSRGQTTGTGGVSTGGPDSPGVVAGEGGTSSAGVGGGGSGVGEAGTSPHPLAISAQDAVMRVAKVLWNAAPDASLLNLANTGMIKTRDDVNQLALRMLKDPRARAGVGAFYRWWLWLDQIATMKFASASILAVGGSLLPDPQRYPEWTPAMSADAAKETETFAVNVTLDIDGSFRTLMTGPFTYANARLASLYGISGIVGDALQKVDLDPSKRGGILTQPALLSLGVGVSPLPRQDTNPPRRGRILRDRFYCEFVDQRPLPPALEPPFSPSNSIRQSFDMVNANTLCARCHYGAELNSLGFPYEEFDQIGRYRTVDDSGHLVNMSGLKVWSDTSKAPVPINGPVQLASALTDMDVVQRCMGQQWLTFALGRPLGAAEDADLDGIHAAFKASSLDLRVLIAAAVASDAFLAPAGASADAGFAASTGTPDAGDGNVSIGTPSQGCSTAPVIFNSHGCTVCHTPTLTTPGLAGFDMTSAGWQTKLVGTGPSPSASTGSACQGKSLNYLNKSQPATGLFLDKLKATPSCGAQMPLPPFSPLSTSELACVQNWADNIVAGGMGQ